MIKVVTVENQKLVCNAFADLIGRLKGFKALYVAYSGEEVLAKLKSEKEIPDIILMDINMSPINGIEATIIITKEYPQVRVIALSMFEDEYNIIEMFRAGARGYLFKNTSRAELEHTIKTVHETGYCYSIEAKEILQKNLDIRDGSLKHILITDREKLFMKLVCRDLSYKEIANIMCISERTVESFRDKLLSKLNVNTKVGIVVFALTRGILEN